MIENIEPILKGIEKYSPVVYEGISLIFPSIPGWVAGRRAEILVNVCRKTQEKLEKSGLKKKQLRYCSLKLGIPLIEEASLEEDETLQDLWATLLTNAMDPDFKEDLRTAYVGIIKELSALDVRVLRLLERLTIKRRNNRLFPMYPAAYKAFKDELRADWEEVCISVENLIRLRLIDITGATKAPKIDESSRNPMLNFSLGAARISPGHNTVLTLSHPHFTSLGLAFLRACVVETKEQGGSFVESSEVDTRID